MKSFFKSSSSKEKEKAAKDKAAKDKAEKEEAERLKNEAKAKDKAVSNISAAAAPGGQEEWPEGEATEGEADISEFFLPTELGVFPRGCVVEIVCGEEGEEERWLPASIIELTIAPGKEHLADEELQPDDGARNEAVVGVLRVFLALMGIKQTTGPRHGQKDAEFSCQ